MPDLARPRRATARAAALFAAACILCLAAAAPPLRAAAPDNVPDAANDSRLVTPEVANAVEALKAGDRQRAAAFLRPAAEAGDADAQALLGQLYLEGGGPERDLFEAGKWLRAAAANGQPEGTYLLATAIDAGVLTDPGMDPDDAAARQAEAARLYRAAATAGSLPAKVETGLRYARGLGTAQDFLAASRWFREAAAEGSPDAQFNLGALHAAGALSGGTPDHAAALPWFEQAAAQGHVDAQYNLGLIAAQGLAGEVDNAAAARWFGAAADQGLADAQAGLAYLAYHGLGTAKDEARAAELYEKAAARGHLVAQNRLARLLIMGRGTAQDIAEAWKWHSLARENGLADEELDARFARLLDDETRREGDARAEAWRESVSTNAHRAP